MALRSIWLDVDNASESQLEFLPIVTDPEYFSEAEVEQLLHAWWRGSANSSIKAAVAEAPVPDIIPQRQAAAGFVFTHREGGLKLFGVGFETGSEELLFRFALPVRGGSYAIEEVDFSKIYPPELVEDIDLATLRERLAKLPCCTTNKRAARIAVIRSISSSSDTDSRRFYGLLPGVAMYASALLHGSLTSCRCGFMQVAMLPCPDFTPPQNSFTSAPHSFATKEALDNLFAQAAERSPICDIIHERMRKSPGVMPAHRALRSTAQACRGAPPPPLAWTDAMELQRSNAALIANAYDAAFIAITPILLVLHTISNRQHPADNR